MDAPLNPMTLPVDDNINPYCFSVDLQGAGANRAAPPEGQWFLHKGKMIAYYGQMRFEALTVASMSALVASHFSSPLYAADWVVATGAGKLILGDRGFDINSYDLDEGNLTVRAANLLAFDTRLDLKQSIVPGFLTLVGTGKFLASSNGPVIFADPPIRVDPEALVGWADCPSPSYHYDGQWMAQNLLGGLRGAFGVLSGEERQFDFTGAGTVLLQSTEKTMADPASLRMMEQQITVLSQAEKQHLHRFIGSQLTQ